ncbi:MAG TPA: hypothetical protein VIC27_02970 [Ktedonobacterales bacterium]
MRSRIDASRDAPGDAPGDAPDFGGFAAPGGCAPSAAFEAFGAF